MDAAPQNPHRAHPYLRCFVYTEQLKMMQGNVIITLEPVVAPFSLCEGYVQAGSSPPGLCVQPNHRAIGQARSAPYALPKSNGWQ